MRGDEPDVVVGLSEPAKDAVTRAVPFLESLVDDLLKEPVRGFGDPPPERAAVRTKTESRKGESL